MSRIEKKAEEPIQPIEKELMLDNPDQVEKWGPSQEGRAEYKPSLNEIEKELLAEARLNPAKQVRAMERAADPDRREKLKEEGRLGLQSDKKYLAVRSLNNVAMGCNGTTLNNISIFTTHRRSRRPGSMWRRNSTRAARSTSRSKARPTRSSPARGTTPRSERHAPITMIVPFRHNKTDQYQNYTWNIHS
jgi:hypothetical protein